MHSHNTRLMQRIDDIVNFPDENEINTMSNVRSLLISMDNEDDKTNRTKIVIKIFNMLIENPIVMMRHERFRVSIQNKVNELSRQLSEGKFISVDKDILDEFVKTLYKLQAIV